MKALVLAGGSIKGAYSAGAQQALFESGWVPDRLYGISVGALIAAYDATLRGRGLSWPEIGAGSVRLWREVVTSPQRVIKARSPVTLGWDLLRKRWGGLYDTTPLRKLIEEWVSWEHALRSDASCSIGVVNLESGALDYRGPGLVSADLSWNDWVLASTAEPILMPAVQQRYVDGGLRDIAPLRQAIDDGADEIVVIATSPEQLEPAPNLKHDLLSLVGRVLGIMLNEALNSDLARCLLVNEKVVLLNALNDRACDSPDADGHRWIHLRVIRPTSPLALGITSFRPADIEALIQRGREDAQFEVSSP